MTLSLPDGGAATAIAEDSRLSCWDAMMVRSASRLGCDVLWTHDLDAGQSITGVAIRSPFG